MTWPEVVDEAVLIVAATIVAWLLTRHRNRRVCEYCPFAKTTRRGGYLSRETAPGTPPPRVARLRSPARGRPDITD